MAALADEPRRAIILAASSDIGTALAGRWLDRGWQVTGTYRTDSAATSDLRQRGMKLVACDLGDSGSLQEALPNLRRFCPEWDAVVVCAGVLDPIGPFAATDFDAWEESFRVNFLRPLRMVRELLPSRSGRTANGPCIVFFAGSGTNDAPRNYSAYTIAKLALVKMCELLDAEVADARFVILGTGWVKTKIHRATLRAGTQAGSNYERTMNKMLGDDCTPLERVLECIDWAVTAPREVASGRNFSVVHDRWQSPELHARLERSASMYKLRRSGNDWRLPSAASLETDMNSNTILDQLLQTLPQIPDAHIPASAYYAFLKQAARTEVETSFRADQPRNFGPFGELAFPYASMGAVDSLNLFDLDELILFSFYWHNRRRYRRVLDVGANLGLHSIILNRCGYEVRCFEPDPTHFGLLKRNLALNHCTGVTPFNAAVSRHAGALEFVRVLGNTTGSHLAGSKPAPYGELERFPVTVEAIGPLLNWADLIKMDVEGHEAEILLGTERSHWENCDGVVEIGSPENARAVYDHFLSRGVRMFAQKTGWKCVADYAAMPTTYKDGSLFITCKDEMPWSSGNAEPTANAA